MREGVGFYVWRDWRDARWKWVMDSAWGWGRGSGRGDELAKDREILRVFGGFCILI